MKIDLQVWLWLYVLVGLVLFYVSSQDLIVNPLASNIFLILGVLLMFGGLYMVGTKKPLIK